MTNQERAFKALIPYLERVVPGVDSEGARLLALGIVRTLLAARIRIVYAGPRRTLTQNAFIHLLFDWLGHNTGMDPDLVKEGILEKYGTRQDNPFLAGGKMVRRTRQYTVDEITPLVEGCFIEAAEAGVDVVAFIEEWERIKRERKQQATG